MHTDNRKVGPSTPMTGKGHGHNLPISSRIMLPVTPSQSIYLW